MSGRERWIWWIQGGGKIWELEKGRVGGPASCSLSLADAVELQGGALRSGSWLVLMTFLIARIAGINSRIIFNGSTIVAWGRGGGGHSRGRRSRRSIRLVHGVLQQLRNVRKEVWNALVACKKKEPRGRAQIKRTWYQITPRTHLRLLSSHKRNK